MIRSTTLLCAILAIGVGLTLFNVKYQVQDLEHELTILNRKIVEDQQAIHVLRAEWSHLNEPARLRGLAQRHLGLAPMAMEQIATPAGLDMRLPELPARPQPATLRSADAEATSP